MKYCVNRKVDSMKDANKSLSMFLEKVKMMTGRSNLSISEHTDSKRRCAVECHSNEKHMLFSDNYKVCLVSPKVRSRFPKYTLSFAQGSSAARNQPHSLLYERGCDKRKGEVTVSGAKKCALLKLNLCESYLSHSVFHAFEKEVDGLRGLEWVRPAITSGLFQAGIGSVSLGNCSCSVNERGPSSLHLSSMSNPSESLVITEKTQGFAENGFYTLEERSDWAKIYAEDLYCRSKATCLNSSAKPLPLTVTLSMAASHRAAVRKVALVVEGVITSFPGACVHFGKTFKGYTGIATEFVVLAPTRIIRCSVKDSMNVVVAGNEYGFSFFPRVIQEILGSK